MDLHTPLCDLLCCDVPIVLAGMGGVARSELVAAVTAAGAFGFLGMVREPAHLVAEEIAAVRRRTTRPFGVNLIPAATKPELFDRELDACLAAGVHAVTLFWDLAPDAIRRIRDHGVLAVCQVGALDEARAAEDAGADVVIVQGREAGGHVRGERPRDALLAQVLEAVDVPVLAAGGVADGRDLAAILDAGAQGAVVGTAFLATEESFAHDYHKQRLVESDGETVLTCDFHINWPAGAAVRVLPNSVTRGARGDPHGGSQLVIGAEEGRPIYLFSTDSPLRSTTGDLEAMALYAGEGAGRIAEILPAAERVRRLADEARAARARPAAGAVPQDRPAAGASPPCFAAEAPDAYMGFATREELARELNTLLEAERAGARVAARLVADAPDAAFRALAKVIHDDEVRWSRALFHALLDLGAQASGEVGAFYGKAMEIKGYEARLAFVNRGQGWVVRRLRELLPRVRDDGLHETLKLMLDAHERNIASAADVLEARPDEAAG